jgi:hypothetical protein
MSTELMSPPPGGLCWVAAGLLCGNGAARGGKLAAPGAAPQCRRLPQQHAVLWRTACPAPGATPVTVLVLSDACCNGSHMLPWPRHSLWPLADAVDESSVCLLCVRLEVIYYDAAVDAIQAMAAKAPDCSDNCGRRPFDDASDSAQVVSRLCLLHAGLTFIYLGGRH